MGLRQATLSRHEPFGQRGDAPRTDSEVPRRACRGGARRQRLPPALPHGDSTNSPRKFLISPPSIDRKSTRLNSSHDQKSYAVFCFKKNIKRYDVDGVHFDDYFYPYKEKDGSGKEMDFPDEASWRRFGAGGKLSRDDWRRENVNTFV